MSVQWPLLLFSVLLGTSSGMLVYLGVFEARGVRPCGRFVIALGALVLLGVGGVASTFHLGHPERALHIMGNMGSGLSRELIGVGVTGVVALVYAVLTKKDYAGASKALGIIGLICGIALPLIAGSSFMMASRPAWDSLALPIMYLGTGLGLGLALAACIACLSGAKDDERAFAVKLALFGIVVAAVTSIIYVAWIAIAPYPDASRCIDRVIAGDMALAFWLGTVACGIALPCVCGALALKASEAQKQGALLGVAFAGLVVGSVALRVIMYAMATSVQQLIY